LLGNSQVFLILRSTIKKTKSRRNSMNGSVRYVHTNLIANDWRSLSSFYQEIFGCVPVPPPRDLSGPELEAGTAIPGAHLQGEHLRLPGCGEDGPTLEIYSYAAMLPHPEPLVNRPGYGHLAFAVGDVAAMRQVVLAAGGQAVGEVVCTRAGQARVTWCYLTDPEGNILELQAWDYPGEGDK
jgi:predicted enzyme related to lactoylglutathione lyase